MSPNWPSRDEFLSKLLATIQEGRRTGLGVIGGPGRDLVTCSTTTQLALRARAALSIFGTATTEEAHGAFWRTTKCLLPWSVVDYIKNLKLSRSRRSAI